MNLAHYSLKEVCWINKPEYGVPSTVGLERESRSQSEMAQLWNCKGPLARWEVPKACAVCV